MRRVLVALTAALVPLLAGAAPPAGAPAPGPEEHVRGAVLGLQGQQLRVRTRDGQDLALALAPEAKVTVARRSDLAHVASGAFVGTTAVPQPDGSLRAVEVHVFPEAMRGTGEGHRPWDLSPGGLTSTMTNGTVAAARPGAPPSTMTNATVARRAAAGAGLRLELQYAGGEKDVVVPPGTPVVELAPGDRSLLVPGAHVFVGVMRDAAGQPVARRAVVGEGDVIPPM